MAVKQLDLTINTSKGEQNLKRLHQFAKQVESVFGNINKLKINVKADPAQKALEKLNAQIKEGQDLINKFNQGAGLTAFGSKISAVTEQVGLIKKAFNDATDATERQRAATAILAGDFKKLTMEATAFANATDKRRNKGLILGNVGETIKEIEKFPKTILAGKNAMSMLNSMLEVVNVNSQEFKDINEAIGRQLEKNAAIEKTINKLTGSDSKRKAKKDQLENEKKRQRILDKTNALTEQSANIEERIKASTLSKAQKEALINDLKRAGVKIKEQEFDLAKQINIETQRNLTMQEKLQRRGSRIAQSAFIGGGFPLLFGGGPAQAIGGALGGGIGEAISPGGGFAGSIAVTALVSKLSEFTDGIKNLGLALDPLKPDLDVIVNSLGIQGTKTAELIQKLRDAGQETKALEVATEQLTLLIGKDGVDSLETFGKDTVELSNEFAKAMTLMQVAVAELLNSIKFLQTLTNALERQNLFKQAQRSDDPIIKDLLQKRTQASKGFLLSGTAPDFKAVQDFENQIITRQRDLNKKDLQTQIDSITNGKGPKTKDFSQFEIDILNQRIALQKTSGSLLDEEVVKIKKGIIESEKLLALERVGNNEKGKEIANLNATIKLNELDKNIEAAKLKDKKELEKFLEGERKNLEQQEAKEKKLADAEVKRINKIKESANSVTKNLEQQNELNTIKLSGSEYEIALAEATIAFTKDQLALFDEEAFKIAFNNKLRIDGLMEQKKITEDIKNLLATEMSTAIKGLITGANSLNDAFRNVLNKMADAFLNIGLFGNVAGNLTKGGGLLGNLFDGLLATGGTARAGKSYIVGERGPEMFTPGVTGTVTPNNALGGSTNVVVNVDASGSSVEGDEQQGRELGRVISAAVQSELIQQKRPGGLLA